jgi:diguanylate cyclase (GGDEF)-like protein
MRGSQNPTAPPKLVARLAVVGMALAVVALGALAVWAAIVTQNGAHGLSRAGVQTSGHLRAVQALSVLDTQTDALEDGVTDSKLRRLRRAQGALREAVERMETGGVAQASRIARDAQPLLRRLDPAVDHFLAAPSAGGEIDLEAEDEMDDLIADLQQLLNQSGSDPSKLLASQLEAVTGSERTVRGTAFVLIPLGLGGVAACGWLLSTYRRRSEAAMLTALELTTQEARTDQLTDLPNRRALLEEFELRSGQAEAFTLALADLNGFKRYNDTFGHPAGDALLRRLGHKLAAACDGNGVAARLGGDEFCILLPAETPLDDVHSLLHEALSEEGEGFHITAASGAAAVPEEAGDSSTALRLADTRMYAAKVSAHPGAEHAISAALTRMLDERHPGLGTHGQEVSELAVACADTLGLAAEEARSVKRAAELHDLGKVGIPSAILTKEGALSDEEWDFMRRHSIIGERILAGLPSMERVATLIRSGHERWDGDGYPDRLAGEQIPVGARIVAVADAFSAMTEDRPYAQARSLQSARAELQACSGTQFDPAVVAAFLNALDRREAHAVADAHPAASQ